MNGCVIPAPAPCANTKHARACGGRIRIAETEAWSAISILSCLVLTAFIRSDRVLLMGAPCEIKQQMPSGFNKRCCRPLHPATVMLTRPIQARSLRAYVDAQFVNFR